MNESYQFKGPDFGGKQGGMGGKRFVPKGTTIPTIVLNDPQIKPHLKFMTSGGETKMFVSPLFKNAMSQIERGRSSYDKESKKSPLNKRIVELFSDDKMKFGNVARGHIKNSIQDKMTSPINMHLVDLDVRKNDEGYSIDWSSKLEMKETIDSTIKSIIKEEVSAIIINSRLANLKKQINTLKTLI